MPTLDHNREDRGGLEDDQMSERRDLIAEAPKARKSIAMIMKECFMVSCRTLPMVMHFAFRKRYQWSGSPYGRSG
jgi:hypothetical protein